MNKNPNGLKFRLKGETLPLYIYNWSTRTNAKVIKKMDYKDKFKDNNITLYNMDCMELLKNTPDNYYDLAIVDPPYGIIEKSNRKNIAKGQSAKRTKYDQSLWDFEKPSEDYFNELFRVSKNQIIWGFNYFIEYLKSTRSVIVWDKHMKESNFADCEMAWTSFNSSAKIFDFAWNGMIQGDMKNKEKRIHPTQKPIKLYEWILMNYAKKGDRILDTHLGSESIAIACNRLGFDFTGSEITLSYFNDSVKRYKEQTAQQQLF